MTHTTFSTSNSSRTDKPFNPAQRRHSDDAILGKQGLVVHPYGCEHTTKAARGAVHLAFGRHARALDHGDFVDRLPGATLVPSPEARFK